MNLENLNALVKLGVNIIPLKKDKTPNLKEWKKYQEELYEVTETNLKLFKSVGVITGKISGNMEVIDIDLKYDITGTLFERYQELVDFLDPTIWDRLVIVKTKNDGVHLIYRCEEIQGNLKLAQRYSTPEEYKNGDKVKVLFETRGEGGYIVSVPSEGYELVQGKISKVHTISISQREILINCARSFDEMDVEAVGSNPNIRWNDEGVKPWEDYNKRVSPLDIVLKYGFTIVKEDAKRVYLKRPGHSDSAYSGNYSKEFNMITMFSSSTAFQPFKPYTAFGCFCLLVCNDDVSQAAKLLSSQGFGTVPTDKNHKSDEEIEILFETEYLSGDESDELLLKYASGEMPAGLSTGYEIFDEHHRFKRGKFNIIGGHAAMGKSTAIWFMALCSNILHGWKWGIYSSENDAWTIKKTLCEFLVGDNAMQMSKDHLKKAMKYINDNFYIIEVEDVCSYREVLKYGEKLKQNKNIDAILIDPYNSLRFDYSEIDRKLSTYEYHYTVSTILKKWAKNNDCTIYLNMHGNTDALRKVHLSGDLKGHIMPLNAADLEQGGMWVNRCDDLLIMHRYIHHAELRLITEIHVKKVKEEFSGGRPTASDFPVALKLTNQHRFYSFFDGKNKSPLLNWFKVNILGEEIKETNDYNEYFNNEERQYASQNSLSSSRQEYEEFEEGEVPF